MHSIDIGIIVVYVISVIIIGVIVSRRASQNLDAYFLSGKSVPWYFLGLSNASSMFDITGTMWLVYIIFVYGAKGIWLPWLWPTWNQIFLMIYLSIWVRRSNVLTGGEWIKTRFGEGQGGHLARLSVVIFALVAVIGFLSYAFKGIGKFADVFFPWGLTPDQYAMIILLITTVYVILGGMYSVVVTDLIQFVLMVIVSIFIGYQAMIAISPEQVAAVVPDGWHSMWFGWTLDIDWNELIPAAMTKIEADKFGLFGILFMMMIFKGILVSAAGPAPGYDMQRILATRTPRESALMSAIVSIALFPRWIMIGGITVLALVHFSPELVAMGNDIDFEKILPWIINSEFIPVGITGLLLAGLLAAFMSTFDSTVNAGASYLVVDVYKAYINPDADDRTSIRMSYLASIAVVVVGIAFGLIVESINYAMQIIVSGLWAGYTAPNVLKWYWWRINGHGYFWGMISGILAAIVTFIGFPDTQPLFLFPIILVVATAASIGGSLMTVPDDETTLKGFYSSVRPWGFWGPIHDKVMAENPNFKANKNFKNDMINVVVGVIWQTSLVTLPLYMVLKDLTTSLISLVVLVATSWFLKMNWYDKLEDQ